MLIFRIVFNLSPHFKSILSNIGKINAIEKNLYKGSIGRYDDNINRTTHNPTNANVDKSKRRVLS